MPSKRHFFMLLDPISWTLAIWGWLSHAMIQLVDDGYHYSQAVRAGDYFIFKLKFLLYGHVMYILIG